MYNMCIYNNYHRFLYIYTVCEVRWVAMPTRLVTGSQPDKFFITGTNPAA